MNLLLPQLTITDKYDPNSCLILHPRDALEFLATVPDQTVTLVVTSPPYNIGKDYEKSISLTDYLNSQRQLIKELYRILKKEGSICWQVGNYIKNGEVFPLDIFYYDLFKEHHLFLRNRIIWHYGHGLHAHKRLSGRYETILWFSKSDNYIFNLDAIRIPSKYPGKRHYKGDKKGQPSGNIKGKNPSDVWEILAQEWSTGLWDIPNVKSNHPEKTAHPCQYPVELVERCVLALTNEDDWVLDPYVGSGTSLIAAIKHQRRAMGCEKEIKYVEIARQRLELWQQGMLKTRELGKPVYQPTGQEKVSQIPDEWRPSLQLDFSGH